MEWKEHITKWKESITEWKEHISKWKEHIKTIVERICFAHKAVTAFHRADINARGFLCHRQKAFFDVRIFDPNAQCHENKTLKICYELNKHEKKSWTRFAYSPCFLDNRWCVKRMLHVCQTIVSDDLTKTKRRI